ncbi:MAG: type II toxin-antitoxin system RelE/ParE family toxin [Eubacteriales bacterium]|nr:type II toxin-antitoxin system RelE/ParE family toxin [Eubacteriales bacterium]
MNYQLHITKTAERDLENAADYIEFTLKNPTAVDHLLGLAEEQFNSLVSFFGEHPVVDDPVLSAWGIRFVTINNYLGFYTVVGDTIYILRFLYGKRDWVSILKQGIDLQ